VWCRGFQSVPYLCTTLLAIEVSNLSFPFSFERGDDRLRVEIFFYSRIPNFFCGLRLVSCCDNLIVSTLFCVLSKVACRFGIAGI